MISDLEQSALGLHVVMEARVEVERVDLAPSGPGKRLRTSSTTLCVRCPSEARSKRARLGEQ